MSNREMFSNYAVGTFTAQGSTALNIPFANLTDSSFIKISCSQFIGGANAGNAYIASRTNGTGFSVNSSAGDLSTYTYWVFNPN